MASVKSVLERDMQRVANKVKSCEIEIAYWRAAYEEVADKLEPLFAEANRLRAVAKHLLKLRYRDSSEWKNDYGASFPFPTSSSAMRVYVKELATLKNDINTGIEFICQKFEEQVLASAEASEYFTFQKNYYSRREYYYRAKRDGCTRRSKYLVSVWKQEKSFQTEEYLRENWPGYKEVSPS